MIAAWMGYVLLVSVVLAVVAALAERIATVQRRARRGIWAVAMLATVVLVLVSPRRGIVARTDLVRRANVVRDLTPGRAAAEPVRFLPAEHVTAPGLVKWGAIGERLQTPLMILWLAGCLVVALLFAGGVITMSRRRRAWRRVSMGGATVWVAAKDGPAVAGLWRPAIVLPEWALSLDDEARGLMLRHEAEHVRARDPWLTHAAGALVLALPWNLPLWWMLSRLRLAIEMDCDARVLGGTPPLSAPAPGARRYGELLLEVATRRSRRLVAAPALLEHSSALGRRIVAMHPRMPRFPRLHNVALSATVLGLSAFAGYRRPPAFGAQRLRMIAPPGWVTADDIRAPLHIAPERPAAQLLTLYPELARASEPSVIALARSPEGTFIRAVRGPGVMGPLRERMPPGTAGPVERLLQARDAAGWRVADAALFGNIPAGDSVRAAAALPVRPGGRTREIGAYRIPAGEAGRGVVYLFLITEDNR